MLNGDVLDVVSRGGISSGAVFKIFRLVSLGPANSLSLTVLLFAYAFPYRPRAVSLARKSVSDYEI